MRREVHARSRERMEGTANLGDHAGVLGDQEDSQGANDGDTEPIGTSPALTVVENDLATRLGECQREDGFLTSIQTPRG